MREKEYRSAMLGLRREKEELQQVRADGGNAVGWLGGDIRC